MIAQVKAYFLPAWALADGYCQELLPRGEPGPLHPSFSTGIKKEPNKFVVPRTVMIGGKVRSWATDHGSGLLLSGLRSALAVLQDGGRGFGHGADSRLCPHRLPLGTTWPR